MADRRQSTHLSSRSSTRDRPNTRGEATRLRLVLKAEELFAQRGIEAVPLSDIGAAAGQRNNVAVQYHFGDREQLVRAIIAHRAAAGEQLRAELLAELVSQGRQPTVRDLVDTFLRSLTCHLTAGNHYLAFISRYVIEHGGYETLDDIHMGGTVRTFSAMTRHLVPHLPPASVDERWRVMMASAVHTLARYQAAMQANVLTAPLDALLADLTTFLTAGLEADAFVLAGGARAS